MNDKPKTNSRFHSIKKKKEEVTCNKAVGIQREGTVSIFFLQCPTAQGNSYSS